MRALRVVSYNIQDGGRWRLPLIARVIRRQQPDIVALLEATHQTPVRLLARALGMRLAFGEANNPFHIAWLSRLPLLRQQNHRHPALAKTVLEVEVAWSGRPLQLFATHLAAGSDVLHPSQEAPVVLDLLRRQAAGAHLLVGDFNALHPDDAVGPPPAHLHDMVPAVDRDPRQAIRAILAAGYLDCYRARHPETAGYSFPATHPWLRLDYIFASPELAAQLRACDVVDTAATRRASDHLPLWAEFAPATAGDGRADSPRGATPATTARGR